MNFDVVPAIVFDPPVRFQPHRLSLHFECGRLVNLFRFIIFRAVFSNEEPYWNATRTVLDEAARIPRCLGQGSPEEAAQAAILQLKENIETRRGSVGWHEVFEAAYNEARYAKTSAELAALYSRPLQVSPGGIEDEPTSCDSSESFSSRSVQGCSTSLEAAQTVWDRLRSYAASDCRELTFAVRGLIQSLDEWRAFSLGRRSCPFSDEICGNWRSWLGGDLLDFRHGRHRTA